MAPAMATAQESPVRLVPGQTHAEFQRSLIESEQARASIALWLWRRGWSIELHPLRVAPALDEREDFTDEGDLFIWRGLEPRRLRIEVKGIRSAPFTGLADWPYPDWIVDSAVKYDACEPKPHATFGVDRLCRAVGIVRHSTFPQWRRVHRFDRVKGQPCWFYVADLRLVEFMDLSKLA